MSQMVFNRYEKKYLIPSEVYEPLREMLNEYMEMDSYGRHTICNIYYDTWDDLLVRRSILDPKYKEKLRLRSYGIPTADSPVFIEIKKKYKGVVNKRRISMPLRDAYSFLDERKTTDNPNQIMQEIDFLLNRYNPRRKLFLAYDRIALFGKENSEFRVTFDENIRYRRIDLNLESGDKGTLLIPDGWHLMETKIMSATPLWFTQILSQLRIYPTSFSKYGNIYRKEHGTFSLEDNMLHRVENWNKNKETDWRELVC